MNLSQIYFQPNNNYASRQLKSKETQYKKEVPVSDSGYQKYSCAHLAFYGLNKSLTNYKRLESLLDSITSNSTNLEKNKEELKTLLTEIINNTIQNNTKMAAGSRNKVYELQPTKYVLRMGLNQNFYPGNIYVPNNSKYSELKNWYGKEVLHYGNAGILVNGDPKRVGICAKGTHAATEIIDIKNHYSKTYLPKLLEAPQEAFDELAKDFSRLNKVNNEIDLDEKLYDRFDNFSPGNVMLIDNKFAIFDEINERDVYPNDSDVMCELLLNKLSTRRKVEYNEENTPAIKQILHKCLKACAKEDLPFAKSLDIDLGTPYTFKLAGMGDKFNEVEAKYKELSDIADKNQRISAMIEYLDKLFNKN